MSLAATAPVAAARPTACRPVPARQALVAPQQAAALRQARRRVQLCRAAAGETEAAPAAAEPAAQVPAQAPAGEDAVAAKPKLMNAAWEKVVEMQRTQETFEVTVKSANRSGLNAPVGKLNGFLPYKLLDPSRLAPRGADGRLAPPPANGHAELVGKTLRVKVSQVIVPERRLIVSEKAVLLDELAAVVQPGDIVEGRVGSLMNWGAFIECHKVNGQPCPAAEAVLPLREASWGWVDSASDLLQTGQAVRVSVLYAQTEPRSKVVVSLKRLENDPLKETLDNVLPLDQPSGSYAPGEMVPASIPNGVDEILEALSEAEGVSAVTLGRCVEEKRTVAQDLELWITKEIVDDGYNLAVRAGRMVQEVHVATAMSPEQMRSTVQRVLRSIN